MARRGAVSNVNTASAEERAEAIHTLDMEYQAAKHKTKMVLRDEEARRLKLQTLLLKDDNAVVREELSRKDKWIGELRGKLSYTQEHLQIWMDRTRVHEKQVHSQARELATLKEEVELLATATNDSAKILTEKLALSRELALLKPELEDLKARLAHENDVLAEKLSIERQLNELEVELANEKRAAEKATKRQQSHESSLEQELRQQIRDMENQLAKERLAAQRSAREHEAKSAEANDKLEELREQLVAAEKELVAEKRAAARAAKTKNVHSGPSQEEVEQLRLKLTETEEALAAEKQDKERIRKESERAVTEAESLRLPLEERIDNLKVKLRETREELKTCRAELQRAQGTTATMPLKVPTKTAAPANKRRAMELSIHDSLLQTPNQDEERPKRTLKKTFVPAAVGEKSTFSITPFLNKTINLNDDSLKPIMEDEEEQAEEAETAEVPVTEAKEHTSKPAKSKTNALAQASSTKHNMSAPPSKSRKALADEITLANVIEDPEAVVADQENLVISTAAETSEKADAVPKKKRMVLKSRTAAAAKASAVIIAEEVQVSAAAARPAVPEPKKKKRKLIGAQTSTLFEDAEDAVPSVPAVAAAKRAPMSGRVNLGAGLAAKRAVGLGTGKGGALGTTFSPLKRDRRGVGASFLA